jgi:hypothetical protein
MAAAQASPTSTNQDDISDWMAQRWRDVQSLRGQAETAGRSLWAQATRAGKNLSEPEPSDIAAIGAQFLKGGAPSARAPASHASDPPFVATPDASTLAALRQQQAWIKQTQLDPLDKQNSWMAAIALAPAALLGFDLPAGLGIGSWAEPALGVTDFPELEAWQAQLERQLGRALTKNEKDALREIARERWAQANGVSAKEMGTQVHHEDPLEYAHLKPDADPNRLSNLLGLRPPGHAVANRAWDLFRRSLGGAQPTPAQVMAQKLWVNPTLEPYVVRPGLPQPPPEPPVGGAP